MSRIYNTAHNKSKIKKIHGLKSLPFSLEGWSFIPKLSNPSLKA
jgi:hypothetical protein